MIECIAVDRYQYHCRYHYRHHHCRHHRHRRRRRSLPLH